VKLIGTKGYSALSPLSGQLLHAPGRNRQFFVSKEKETKRGDIYLKPEHDDVKNQNKPAALCIVGFIGGVG